MAPVGSLLIRPTSSQDSLALSCRVSISMVRVLNFKKLKKIFLHTNRCKEIICAIQKYHN